MSCASSASLMASRSIPKAAGSTTTQVSQRWSSRRRLRMNEPDRTVEQLAVAVADPPPRGDLLGERLQLRAPERGEDVAHPVVEADLGVLVVGDGLPRLRRELPRVLDQVSARRDEHPAPLVVMILLPLNEKAASAPARLTARLDRSPERLGGVLDRALCRARTDLGERVVVAALAVEIHGDDGADARPRRGAP